MSDPTVYYWIKPNVVRMLPPNPVLTLDGEPGPKYRATHLPDAQMPRNKVQALSDWRKPATRPEHG